MKNRNRGISSSNARASADATRSSQVPDQYWGYSLQAIRFLQVLMEAQPGTTVSLEVFEDVGTVAQDGQILASQVKTGLVKNPLTDRSIEFWKTLDNWVCAVESNVLDPASTTFEIYAAKPRKGHLASAFHDAQSEAQATAAIQEAEAILLGKTGRRDRLAVDVYPHVVHVLRSDRSALTQIVQRFRITTAKQNPLADLRPIVITKWVRPESIDLVIQHAHGWLKERLDGLLQERKPAAVSADEFNEEMRRFMPRCDFRHILANMAGRPTEDQIAAEKVRTYVRQLDLIELEEEASLEAINNYLRATVMRTKLGEEGIVHDDSFVDFEEALISFWRNKRRQNNLSHPAHTHIEKGQLLFSDCSLHRQRLQGLELPDYFTPGSYQSLADELQIGWHPNYYTIFKEPER